MKWLFLFVVRPLSRLPYRILYGISNGLAVVLGKWVGYRRKVVRAGLEASFPEAGPAEWDRMERGVYAHLADLMVESVKHFTVGEREARSRMQYENTQLFDPAFAAGRHVLIAGGHLNNWELYALTADAALPHRTMAIYKRLSHPYMDRVMQESRSRWGLTMVPTVASASWMEREVGQPNPHPWAVVMGFDQSPADPRKAWWTTFLGQETAWYYGLEKYARTYDMAVLYGHIRKPSRGHYVTEYELITDNPRSFPEGAILEACITRLEADIRANPAQWLWTHKRWKHRRPADLPLHPRTAP
jgi:KDO2-lipid IV(A) lauroyltransferase